MKAKKAVANATQTKTGQKILDYVKKHKRVRPKEISQHLSIGNRTLYKYLKTLCTQGFLYKRGRPPKVYYILADAFEDVYSTVQTKPFKITKKQQLKEITSRITPILNVDIVIYKDGKYLIGRRSKKKNPLYFGIWLYPGGRMKYNETPQETAERILKTEVPGVNAKLRKLITAVSDKGTDPRAYGVTLYYLYEYISGKPMPSYQLDKSAWLTKDDFLKKERTHWCDKSFIDELDLAVRTINTSQDELLVEFDKDNKEIGTIIKRDAHSDPNKFHRAAHIFIFTSNGDVILHQRSLNKSTAPGKWDMFGGHQVSGHTIEQTANQELAEELGITTKLTFKKTWLYKSTMQSEFCYLYYGVSDGPYGFDRNEVAQIKKFDCQKLLDGKYDKEFDILPHVYDYLEELKSVWVKLRL